MERGRPSKLTADVQDKLVKAISQGNYYEAACSYAGIDYATFRRWMVKAEEEESGEYCDFCEVIKKAESAAELRLVQEWQKHIPNSWQAIATFMERRYPDRWGRSDKRLVELTGKDGSDVNINIKRV